jgi:hypothetical protein
MRSTRLFCSHACNRQINPVSLQHSPLDQPSTITIIFNALGPYAPFVLRVLRALLKVERWKLDVQDPRPSTFSLHPQVTITYSPHMGDSLASLHRPADRLTCHFRRAYLSPTCHFQNATFAQCFQATCHSCHHLSPRGPLGRRRPKRSPSCLSLQQADYKPIQVHHQPIQTDTN